jgi:E1-E2 ATPase
MPTAKETGSTVYAGSINVDSEFAHRSRARPPTTPSLASSTWFEEAQASKASTACFIERFSRLYTPAAMMVSALVVLVPPLMFGADWFTRIHRGLAVLMRSLPMTPIYLDYNASTPIDPAVAAAMRPFLDSHYGNPSSVYYLCRSIFLGPERGVSD